MQYPRGPTALFGLGAEIGRVPERLGEDLPARDGLLRLGGGVLLGRGVPPGAEEAVFADGVEVVHRSRDDHLAGGLIDFPALEHPEAEAT